MDEVNLKPPYQKLKEKKGPDSETTATKACLTIIPRMYGEIDPFGTIFNKFNFVLKIRIKFHLQKNWFVSLKMASSESDQDGVIINMEGFRSTFGFLYRQLAIQEIKMNYTYLFNFYHPNIEFYKLSEENRRRIFYVTKNIYKLKLMSKKPNSAIENNFSSWKKENEIYDIVLELGKQYPIIYYKGGHIEKDLLTKFKIRYKM